MKIHIKKPPIRVGSAERVFEQVMIMLASICGPDCDIAAPR